MTQKSSIYVYVAFFLRLVEIGYKTYITGDSCFEKKKEKAKELLVREIYI